MIEVANFHSSPIIFGSLLSEIESFMFGETKQDSSHCSTQEKLLYKGEDSKSLVGNSEDDYLSAKNDYLVTSDYLSAKNDYLVTSDYLSAKNDYLLATADLQSKSLQ